MNPGEMRERIWGGGPKTGKASAAKKREKNLRREEKKLWVSQQEKKTEL